MRAQSAAIACAILVMPLAGCANADEPGGMTFEEMCELPPRAADIHAETQGTDVILTWHDSTDIDFDREYWVATRAVGTQDWEIVEQFALPAGSELRHVLQGQVPDAPAEYTLDEFDGCVTSDDEVCGLNPECPIATLTPRDEE